MAAKYPLIEVPDAVYLHGRGAVGPKEAGMIYYPYHGIHISFLLQSVMLGIHVPAGAVVLLDDADIRIQANTARGTYQRSFALQAAPHSSIGINVFPDLYGQRDPLTAPDFFGPLTGAGNGDALVWYFFRGKDPEDLRRTVRIPSSLRSGTILLPSMTINGVHYERQLLTFIEKTEVGLVCAMCN
jgi:hypothetical protein